MAVPFEHEKKNGIYDRHKNAMSCYNSGDYENALQLWTAIKKEKPDFEGIDRFILLTARKIDSSNAEKKPSLYRTQRDLLSLSGQGPRKRVFHPHASPAGLRVKLRHRHIALVFLTILLAMLFISVRNNRTYMIMLNPGNQHLDCFQGSFFPFGWQKTKELHIGIEHDWVSYVQNREFIRKLQRGVIVRSREQFDEKIIEIFMTLGDESALQMTERGQQSAIYYYKRVYDANFRDRVMSKIIKSFANLARIKIQEKDYRLAQRYIQSAVAYNADDPEIVRVRNELLEAKAQDQQRR